MWFADTFGAFAVTQAVVMDFINYHNSFVQDKLAHLSEDEKDILVTQAAHSSPSFCPRDSAPDISSALGLLSRVRI